MQRGAVWLGVALIFTGGIIAFAGGILSNNSYGTFISAVEER